MGAQKRLHLTATKTSKNGQLQQQLSIGAGLAAAEHHQEIIAAAMDTTVI